MQCFVHANFSAPPSYIEVMGSAVQLNEEGEHTIGNRPFNPMYPVYDFNTQPYPFGSESEPSTSNAPPRAAPGSISEDGIIQKY